MRPWREAARQETLFRTDLPGGVLVPAAPPGGMARAAALVPAPVRRAARAVAAEVAVFVLVAAALAVFHQAALAQLTPPPAPAPVCGNSFILSGPATPPTGAVTVPAGDNSAFSFSTPGATYWFATGTHTLGSSQFSQIDPGNGATFTGSPGAVLDGQGVNFFAFAGTGTGITIEYLTIQDFNPPGSQSAVNVNGEPGWTEQYDTVQDNIPGAGIGVGTNGTVTGNCLTENGEYGFNAFTVADVNPVTGGAQGVTMTGNEISYNNTCDWEDVPVGSNPGQFPITPPAGCAGAGQFVGCGCSGGGKFWANQGGTFTGNYVLGNYSTGTWWDTDNSGWLISGNYFAGNWGSGLTYEISYNADITGNTFVGNAWGAGAFVGGGFPETAIYISESGSDSRAPGPYGTTFQVTGNQFYDNWGGVALWENSDRFCGTLSPSGDGGCTPVNPQWSFEERGPCSTAVPVPGNKPVSGASPPTRRGRGTPGSSGGISARSIFTQPYYSDCRWKTQNVHLSGNLFDYTPADIGPSCTVANFCGFNGVFSEVGVTPPYTGTVIEQAITFTQGNLFAGNTYCGPWGFDALELGHQYPWATWTGTPYNQDAGSTINGPACTAQPYPASPGRWQRPVTIPYRTGRR